ncbi:GTP cyclohydrolase II (plasmid) [Shinella sp. H4-D48]|uniref:GTP cyclohydrolase II n=1 Tax=Shinella sp. H4-D48 TaxID=2925841 RepID=UPI001F53AF14|nr:GTP cyclohydrolase II [Shinella sp. H4-D48]UNK40930.1 GTP cyclohydrolase II [Shinella sp. H4-D48]
MIPPKETRIFRYSEAKLPSRYGQFRVIAYREQPSDVEHLAMVYGTPENRKAPLVRVHSECLTGEALGSLRCDCGEQLESALRLISDAGDGCLIYLRGHEGRGIGLANKIAAYALQDMGLDTFDANERLGFAPDAREFVAAAAILHDLGLTSIELLTNNPAKVSKLMDAGIHVPARRSLIGAFNASNATYLAAKKARFGHLIGPAS